MAESAEMIGRYVKVKQETQSLPNTAVAELMVAVLDKKSSFRFTAPGFSMTPFIRDGDIITIAQGRRRCGDVVAFVNPGNGKLTVHRIVHISPEGYLIKGDNLPCPDCRIPGSAIIGSVVRVEHGGRQVRLGLGMERIVVALLSRRGWLPLVWIVRRFIKSVAGRHTS